MTFLDKGEMTMMFFSCGGRRARKWMKMEKVNAPPLLRSILQMGGNAFSPAKCCGSIYSCWRVPCPPVCCRSAQQPQNGCIVWQVPPRPLPRGRGMRLMPRGGGSRTEAKGESGCHICHWRTGRRSRGCCALWRA